MNRDANIFGHHTTVPSASMVFCNTVASLLFVLIYDCLVVPFLRRSLNFTPTMLQRIGVGFIVSMLSLINAFLVERMRLHKYDSGAVHLAEVDGKETEVVELSVWWSAPSFALTGIAEVLTLAGLAEFYYNQVCFF